MANDPVNLDLSKGSEPRLHINFSGWEDEDKKVFVHSIHANPAVTEIRRTGGNTGAYVYFDPTQSNFEDLAFFIKDLSAAESFSGAETIVDWQEDEVREESMEQQSISSSDWTGAVSGQQKLVQVRALLPSAMQYVESLMTAGREIGHNGGPEWDEVPDLEPLRELHRVLGKMLELADSGAWDEPRFEGLVADAMRFALTVRNNISKDAPYATGLGIVTAILAFIDPTVAIAGLAAGVVAKGQKDRT